MCSFKYCHGNGSCFLGKSSPCSNHASPARPAGLAARRPGLRYDGFLDIEAVLALIDAGQSVESATRAGNADIVPEFRPHPRPNELERRVA